MIVPCVLFLAGLAGRGWWASLLHAGVPEIMATPTSHAQSATQVLERLQHGSCRWHIAMQRKHNCRS
ncbi:hypothetical protein C5F52_24495 [Limnohabitans sp. TS-CS-82]|nr:hypothetical protein C5F52_24495 [Limnohabitans sp. TS-CS-82]